MHKPASRHTSCARTSHTHTPIERICSREDHQSRPSTALRHSHRHIALLAPPFSVAYIMHARPASSHTRLAACRQFSTGFAHGALAMAKRSRSPTPTLPVLTLPNKRTRQPPPGKARCSASPLPPRAKPPVPQPVPMPSQPIPRPSQPVPTPTPTRTPTRLFLNFAFDCYVDFFIGVRVNFGR
jgi:hypothetical protein